METHPKTLDPPANRPRRLYPVVCVDTFIGEDAAEAILAIDPAAVVRVVRSADEAAALLARNGAVTAVLVISPCSRLCGSPLVARLCVQDLPLMIIANSPVSLGDIPCRTFAAESPFTNETIFDLVSQAIDLTG